MINSISANSFLAGVPLAVQTVPVRGQSAFRVESIQPRREGQNLTDRVELSPEAQDAAETELGAKVNGNAGLHASDVHGRASQSAGDELELTEQDQKQLDQLKKGDAEVRRHEQAHKASGGQHAGAISYSFTTGPDGRRYAVSGEVPIDVSPIEGDANATIAKMRQIRRAALAPAQPSSADRQVAAKALQNERKAQLELSEERREELKSNEANSSSDVDRNADINNEQRSESQNESKPADELTERSNDVSAYSNAYTGPSKLDSSYAGHRVNLVA